MKEFGKKETPLALLLDGLRVLVLEDEALIAMDVEQLCLEHGASHVTVLGDLAEIDAEAAASGFDAAIVDLMLGGVSTLDFARQLRDRKVPFVFATGHSETEEIKQAFPGVILVGKPYSGLDLIEAVARSRGAPAPQEFGDAIT